MRAVITRLNPNGAREKLLVDGWIDCPNPQANQIKTRTLFSGISNGTDRNDLIGGNYANYRSNETLPTSFGYQNVGKVIAVGPDVKTLNIGDIVYLSQNHLEYCLVPEDSLLVKLPNQVNPEEAALLGLASAAMRSCRTASLEEGDRLLIVGAGCIGQIAAQIANTMGARVTICDIDQRRLDLAQRIGAAELVLELDENNWGSFIKKNTYQAVLDVAGVVGMEDRLIEATVRGGIVLFIAGRFQVKYTFNLGQSREITIKQNSHFDNENLTDVCNLLADKQLDIRAIIRHVFPIEDANKIYEIIRDKPHELLGTVFNWTT
jgi:2-desacetyl-2-hydroxyethyl bacteriochlorophyllide A dehydrogenase